MLKQIFLWIIVSAFFFVACHQESRRRTTLAVINARIWTGNSEQPWAEALAISGNKIIAVGTNIEIQLFIDDSTYVIDAEGMMVTPGFIDSHVHFLEGGFQLSSVQLRDARTKQEFINRISKYARTVEPGTWITGGNWDHSLWGGELPRADWIDKVTPNNPVWVIRLDGHMALANHYAMKLAGITGETQDIAGGTIVRDKNGQPTGIFKDNAMALIEKIVPEPTEQMKLRALKAATDYVIQQGVTSVHHMGSWDDLTTFEKAHQSGNLKTRIYAAVPLSSWQKLQEKIQRKGNGDQWLKIGGLKGFADGSLGSHTAAFFQPYTDSPKDSGLIVNSPDKLYQWVSKSDKAGLQAIVHAIGDRANFMMLNIYEQVVNENGERDRRFRIEHAQHLAATDIPRFAELGIIASMQPYHAIDDGRWAEQFIGPERIKTTYAFRSLLDTGATLVFGSDWYVAPPIPILGIYAAVTRRTLDNKHPNGWVPEQKITVDEALRAYTINAAYASFEEQLKGSLIPGKLADFVILNQDITTIPSEQIPYTKVMMTVIDGKIVFQRNFD